MLQALYQFLSCKKLILVHNNIWFCKIALSYDQIVKIIVVHFSCALVQYILYTILHAAELNKIHVALMGKLWGVYFECIGNNDLVITQTQLMLKRGYNVNIFNPHVVTQ